MAWTWGWVNVVCSTVGWVTVWVMVVWFVRSTVVARSRIRSVLLSVTVVGRWTRLGGGMVMAVFILGLDCMTGVLVRCVMVTTVRPLFVTARLTLGVFSRSV